MAENDEEPKHGLKDRITGLGQEIIGDIEIIGGVLTGDPITQAEGEFNVEVGTVREELEESLDDQEQRDTETADQT